MGRAREFNLTCHRFKLNGYLNDNSSGSYTPFHGNREKGERAALLLWKGGVALKQFPYLIIREVGAGPFPRSDTGESKKKKERKKKKKPSDIE